MSQLSDKLKALGVSLGPGSLKKPSSVTSLSQVIPGEYTHQDQVFFTSGIFDAQYLHGQYHLWLHAFDTIPNLLELDFKLQDLVFIDAETTGLSGGTGTFAFMLGLGWFDQSNAFHVKQLFLPGPAAEGAFLTVLEEELVPFTTVVSFNGKSFDIPLLNNRYILHTRPSPFAEMQHIDLLHFARRLWRYRLPSRTLGELETHILQFSRGEEELPGWMAPKLYLDYLQTGDAAPLRGMFYHNQIDIVSLAALLCAIENRASFHIERGDEMFALAELYESRNDIPAALRAYMETTRLGGDPHLTREAFYRMGIIARRANDWQLAIKYWFQTADTHLAACIELSKYYEHQIRDLENAALWCKTALELVRNHHPSQGTILPREVEELNHRLERIQKKQNINGDQS